MRVERAFLAGVALSCVLASGGALAAGVRPMAVDDFAKVVSISDPQLSPDERFVAYVEQRIDLAADAGRSQLWQVDLDGGDPLPLTHGAESVSTPRWSPDGRYLSFLSARQQGARVPSTQVWALDRRGGEALPLTEIEGDLLDYVWSPDSKRLALVMRAPDPAAPAADKATEARPTPYVIDRFNFKDDSEGYLHQGVRPGRIYLYEIATRALAALTTDTRFGESSPAWSPDSTQLAFVSNRDEHWDRTINEDVWVAEARAGATPRRLSTSAGRDLAPEWSPDGREILYLQGPEPRYSYYGPYTLAVTSVAAGTVRYPTSTLDRDIPAAKFSADGRFIRFLVGDNRENYLAQVPTGGGSVRRISPASHVVSDYAAGAKRTVILSSHEGRPSELFAMNRQAMQPLTQANVRALQGIALSPSEDFQFTATDGTRVYGVLTRPPGLAQPAAGLPLLLWIHGGPYGQDTFGFHFQRQLFAAQGYAVLQVNYRGSSGRGTAFGLDTFADWGNKDLTDLLDGVNHAIERGIADPRRLMVGGWSNGGVMTNYVIARDPRFKAAISGAGYGNLLSFYGSDMYAFVYDHEITPPWADRERWLRLSYPLFEADKIRTPTLYVGGQLDFNVPIIGGEQMYQALKSVGVPTQLVIYPGEHHGIARPSFRQDLLTRYVEWYARFLGR